MFWEILEFDKINPTQFQDNAVKSKYVCISSFLPHCLCFVTVSLCFFLRGGWPSVYEKGKPFDSQPESMRRSTHHNPNLSGDQPTKFKGKVWKHMYREKMWKQASSVSFLFLCPTNLSNNTRGVKTEEIRKGRIFPGLRDIRRVFLEIVPLHKSKEKRGQTEETPRTTQENNVFHVFFP